MSNFFSLAKNPDTGKKEYAQFIDNYFGEHEYGVYFPSTKITYRDDLVEIIPTESYVEKMETKYKIADSEGNVIYAVIHEPNKEVTLIPFHGGDKFEIRKTNPGKLQSLINLFNKVKDLL